MRLDSATRERGYGIVDRMRAETLGVGFRSTEELIATDRRVGCGYVAPVRRTRARRGRRRHGRRLVRRPIGR